MHRTALTLAAVLALAVGTLPAAHAGHGSTTHEGNIAAGTAGTGYPGCNPFNPDEGLTTATWNVSGFVGHNFELVPALTLDAQVYFYDESCSSLDYDGGAVGPLGETERGIVPPGAQWAWVVGEEGSGDYTFTLEASTDDLLPREAGNLYVGGPALAAESSSLPVADETVASQFNYGGDYFPLHGTESTAEITHFDVNRFLDHEFQYEFVDLRGETIDHGCAPSEGTTLSVPDGAYGLFLHTGATPDYVFGCDGTETFGFFEVTFR